MLTADLHFDGWLAEIFEHGDAPSPAADRLFHDISEAPREKARRWVVTITLPTLYLKLLFAILLSLLLVRDDDGLLIHWQFWWWQMPIFVASSLFWAFLRSLLDESVEDLHVVRHLVIDLIASIPSMMVPVNKLLFQLFSCFKLLLRFLCWNCSLLLSVIHNFLLKKCLLSLFHFDFILICKWSDIVQNKGKVYAKSESYFWFPPTPI